MRLYSWGSGATGVLGHGQTDDVSRPRPCSNMPDIVLVACGGMHSLAVTSSQQLLAWGESGDGQCGLAPVASTLVFSPVTIQLSSPSSSITLPSPFSSSVIPSSLSIPVPSRIHIRQVACGWRHSACVTSTGQVFCWGWGQHGQLGYLSSPSSSSSLATDAGPPPDCSLVPRLVDGLLANNSRNPAVIVAVSCGWKHTAVIGSQYEVFAWGSNSKGQVGVASMPASLSFSSAAGAASHTRSNEVEMKKKKKRDCQVFFVPVQVPLPTSTSSASSPSSSSASPLRVSPVLPLIACGREFTICNSASGILYAWGNNSFGQLGTGRTSSASSSSSSSLATPVAVDLSALTEKEKEEEQDEGDVILSVSCGWSHAAALTKTGAVLVWGRGDMGQLGLGHVRSNDSNTSAACLLIPQLVFPFAPSRAFPASFPPSSSPFSFSTAATTGRGSLNAKHVRAVQVCCGSEHTMVVDEEGGIWGWGWNEHGNISGEESRKEDEKPRGEVENLGGAAIVWSPVIVVVPVDRVEEEQVAETIKKRPVLATGGAAVLCLCPDRNS